MTPVAAARAPWRAACGLLALGLVAGACGAREPHAPRRAWRVERASPSPAPPARRRHPGHEHEHGAHPHAAGDHHHHPHPHPHLAGLDGHHHPS